MSRVDEIKQNLRAFYASEAQALGSDSWISAGGSARVPESRASQYFVGRKVEEAIALTRLEPDRRVLEVGCSFGHMTFLLAERFREVVAVDLSGESVELARRRAAHYGVRNVEFHQADAENLGRVADGSFDGAFSFSTIRFCPNPERALAEIHRALKPDGVVAVDVPNRDCPWYGPLKRLLRIAPHIHDRLYTSGEIREGLRQAGFAEVRARHILFTTKRVPDTLLPAFKLLDRALEPVPGVRRLSGIIMAAGRKDGGR